METERVLRAFGLTTVFGNPGSTELKFLRDWPADFRYVMALHEACAVAMADAYAQLTRNAAFVSLHSAGGLGNAMGTIFTAYRNQAPLVILAGQQTRAMLPTDPFLFAADATTLPRPYVKWACEPARAADVPAAIARAYYIAMQRPYGPTFVSVCEDDWDAVSEPVIVRDIRSDFVADDAVLDALAAALNASAAPAFVVGSGVDRDDAVAEVLELAGRLQAPVFASALASRCSFPEDHPLFAGALPRIRSGVLQALAPYDLVVVLGAPAFNYHVYSGGDFVQPGTALFQLTDDPAAAAASGAGTAIMTALRPALRHLLRDVLPASGHAAPARITPDVPASKGISISLLLATLRDTVPPDVIIVEEAPSTHTVLHDFGLLKPGAYFSAASGSLGYGLPAAVGAALAAPQRRVVALIGDGSSYYGIQGLWTAAQHRLPITFVIVNNAGYGAMKQFTQHLKLSATPSFDISGADVEQIAAGFGCAARRVEDPHALAAALRESMTGSGPVVLNVIVDAGLPQLY